LSRSVVIIEIIIRLAPEEMSNEPEREKERERERESFEDET